MYKLHNFLPTLYVCVWKRNNKAEFPTWFRHRYCRKLQKGLRGEMFWEVTVTMKLLSCLSRWPLEGTASICICKVSAQSYNSIPGRKAWEFQLIQQWNSLYMSLQFPINSSLQAWITMRVWGSHISWGAGELIQIWFSWKYPALYSAYTVCLLTTSAICYSANGPLALSKLPSP